MDRTVAAAASIAAVVSAGSVLWKLAAASRRLLERLPPLSTSTEPRAARPATANARGRQREGPFRSVPCRWLPTIPWDTNARHLAAAHNSCGVKEDRHAIHHRGLEPAHAPERVASNRPMCECVSHAAVCKGCDAARRKNAAISSGPARARSAKVGLCYARHLSDAARHAGAAAGRLGDKSVCSVRPGAPTSAAANA